MSNEGQILAHTMTGEIYQPIRLYYRIYDRSLLLKKFKKLKCAQFDSKRTRWVWLYADECKELPFENPYDLLPEECQGNVVLGSFHFHGSSHVCLDVSSHERALLALEFFNEHIPFDIIRVEHADIINCLFNIDEIQKVNLSKLLDNPCQAIKTIASNADSQYPVIEVLPLHFYEDGLGSVKNVLIFRQVVAKEHWLGNSQFKSSDLIDRVIKDMTEIA